MLAHRSCTGGKTEDFVAAAQLMHRAGGEVKVPTYLVPATQKVDAPPAHPPLSCRCSRRSRIMPYLNHKPGPRAP